MRCIFAQHVKSGWNILALSTEAHEPTEVVHAVTPIHPEESSERIDATIVRNMNPNTQVLPGGNTTEETATMTIKGKGAMM